MRRRHGVRGGGALTPGRVPRTPGGTPVELEGLGSVGEELLAQNAELRKSCGRSEVSVRKEPDPVSSPSASPSASPAGQDAKVSRSVMGGPGTGVQAPVKAQRQAPVVGRATTQAGPAAAKPAAKVAARGPKTPDQIAAEMRRIFGLEDKSPATPPPSTPAPNPPAPVRMEPQPTASSSSAGRAVKSTYETSIDSHVGEAARDHHLLESTVGQVRGDRGAIGNLGGRVRKRKPGKASAVAGG